MGAGRKAARGMKAYLGLRDTESVYLPAPAPQPPIGSSASTAVNADSPASPRLRSTS
jgi:hypothetical protein